jgi:hypothetical protein
LNGDPVSWFMIEPGWPVEDANGERVGRVAAVLGDEEKDIFSGLALRGRDEPIPAERIAEIREGLIRLS